MATTHDCPDCGTQYLWRSLATPQACEHCGTPTTRMVVSRERDGSGEQDAAVLCAGCSHATGTLDQMVSDHMANCDGCRHCHKPTHRAPVDGGCACYECGNCGEFHGALDHCATVAVSHG